MEGRWVSKDKKWKDGEIEDGRQWGRIDVDEKMGSNAGREGVEADWILFVFH